MSTLPLPAAADLENDRADILRRVKSIVGGSIGNLVEWYDFYVYSAFTLYFAKSFFPSGDQTAQLLQSAAVFALGFLMRPIGGWFFGRYADKHGRKAALTTSITLMCAGSLAIAVTPTYASIGLGAPAMLLLARMVQGLSLGGEYGTSATYLSEMATPHRRGFYSSFQYVTLIGGQLLALGVLIVLQQFLSAKELEAWGWRVPFFIGALCALVALYLRRRLHETDAFEAARGVSTARGTLRELARYPKQIATVVGLTIGGTVAFYTYTNYMQKYLVNTAGFSKDAATMVSGVSLLIALFFQPLMGAVSDKVGRRPVLLTFGVLSALLSVPILDALGTVKTVPAALALVVVALAITSCYTSINAVVKAELFPTAVRALGVGMPYAVTVAIFGGTTEFLALYSKQQGHEPWFFWYVAGCAAISMLVYWRMTETRHRALHT